MRPIDADALKEKIEQCEGEGTIARYCKRVLAECLDNDAPTIDAIPVEWLRNLCTIAKMETDDEIFIDWLIQTWQEEQEAGQ